MAEEPNGAAVVRPVQPQMGAASENALQSVRLRPRADNASRAVSVAELEDVPPEEEDHRVGQPYDPLEELLSLDVTRGIEESVDLRPVFQSKWTVKALSNERNAELLERATRYKRNPRTQEQIRELDNIEFTRLIVAYCVTSPNLLDPKLYAKYGVDRKRPDQLVAKILLPGHVDRLAGVIMRISGFRDDLVTEAKNLSSSEA